MYLKCKSSFLEPNSSASENKSESLWLYIHCDYKLLFSFIFLFKNYFLFMAVVRGGYSLVVGGRLPTGVLLFRSAGSKCKAQASVVGEHGLSCPMAYEIFLD